jgi:hypothetical protein
VSEQISPFHAAITAFEIRFEKELISRWQDLEFAAAGATVGAPSITKYHALNNFFDDAGEAIRSVVHEYFPRLLQVATAQRQHLGNESPLAWTQAQVLRQVCNFLGVDEKFDHDSPPRDDSRLVVATARIALGIISDEAIPAEFVLPGWVDSRWALSQVLRRGGPRLEDGAGSLPPRSRAETLVWIKGREFWLSRKIERQIGNELWDGLIEAGKSNVSVLDAFFAAEQPDGKKSTQGRTDPNEGSFVREATTRVISFGDEICRLKTMVGLDYISVLLQNPGKPIRALELQILAGGMSAGPGGAAGSSADDVYTEKNRLPR